MAATSRAAAERGPLRVGGAWDRKRSNTKHRPELDGMVGEVLAQVTGFRCGCQELHGASDLAQHVARHINARVFQPDTP